MQYHCSAALPPRTFSAASLAEAPASRARRAARIRAAWSTNARCSRSRARDDVESRIVEAPRRALGNRARPVRRQQPVRQDANSTLLVNGVNLHAAGGRRLLRRFAFVPQARLDDVMVSYATPGGGVGPHVDSYDVFLLQGPGRRRWRVWFRRQDPENTCSEPGDLLYLPPGVGHDGVALDPCFTYSIGFRAPRGAELGAAFLDWLHERGLPDAGYRDPGLRRPAAADASRAQLIAFAEGCSRASAGRARRRAIRGRIPEQPKPHVVFDRRPRPPAAARARRSCSIPRRSCSTAAGASSSTARSFAAGRQAARPACASWRTSVAAAGARLALPAWRGLISRMAACRDTCSLEKARERDAPIVRALRRPTPASRPRSTGCSQQPGRELRIFDPDGAALRLNDPRASSSSSASCSRAARGASSSWCTTPTT